ncbi:MAG: hypothetical protein WBF53_14810 [Litorimonas sp.]
MRRFLEIAWVAVKFAAIIGLVALGSCTTARTLLKQAPTELPRGWQAPVGHTLPEDQARRLLETVFYGPVDMSPRYSASAPELLDTAALDGRATLMQWSIDVSFGGASRSVDLIALFPNDKPRAPLIISQNFCPNHNVVSLQGVRAPEDMMFDCGGPGLANLAMKAVFGRHIVTPPLEAILERGYAFAAIYPSQFVPDSARDGAAALEDMFPEESERPGALSAWASLFPVVAKVIEAERGERAVIAYGHSRFGKTALMAGAWSDDVDAVIAHQSGTLGASALDDGIGEPLDGLLSAYPHWPGRGLAAYADNPHALPVRPADLLALTGEKPVLLGNARRDVWSDPWGAFTEAKRAWPSAFKATRPADYRPSDLKAYWLRPGTHGVVKEDWPAFLDFLDAQDLE